LTGEVVPAGDRNTRLVIIGNLLHEDSLIMRLKDDIEKQKINGVFKAYPLIKDGEILWPGKYPDVTAVEEEKGKAANEFAWQREYLLNIVPAEDQAIDPKWIQYYDVIPPPIHIDSIYTSHMETRIGIDPAISKNDAADYTAIVPGLFFELREGYRIYILPKIINKRMNFPETVEICKVLNKSYTNDGMGPKFVIEDVAYQKALPQQLINEGIENVLTTRPGIQDKRSRLVLTANMIKQGKILFPKEGAKELIQQIVHFGVEKHDDLADAFSNLVHSMADHPPYTPRIYFA
jgi:predicted phage terminase large subunit-like protein